MDSHVLILFLSSMYRVQAQYSVCQLFHWYISFFFFAFPFQLQELLYPKYFCVTECVFFSRVCYLLGLWESGELDGKLAFEFIHISISFFFSHPHSNFVLLPGKPNVQNQDFFCRPSLFLAHTWNRNCPKSSTSRLTYNQPHNKDIFLLILLWFFCSITRKLI